MYVRWQRRTCKQRSRLDNQAIPVFMSAILVASHRVDGKPRQRHIAYLGGIQDVHLSDADARCRFWRDAQKRLDGLDLANAHRLRAEDALARVVARPPGVAEGTA